MVARVEQGDFYDQMTRIQKLMIIYIHIHKYQQVFVLW